LVNGFSSGQREAECGNITWIIVLRRSCRVRIVAVTITNDNVVLGAFHKHLSTDSVILARPENQVGVSADIGRQGVELLLRRKGQNLLKTPGELTNASIVADIYPGSVTACYSRARSSVDNDVGIVIKGIDVVVGIQVRCRSECA
jgi:hypothetical protein